jgi:hypothetical protein
MTYTVKLIQELPSAIEAAVTDYLNAASPTTIHAISSVNLGKFISVLIVYE